MAFIHITNIKGLVYVPEDDGGVKKHPCPDCYACQMCSDARCELCLKSKTSRETKPKG